MNEKIDEPITVNLDHNSLPSSVIWKNRFYEITKIGFHHKYKIGQTIIHVFSVTTDSLFLRLELDSSNLLWRLKEAVSYE